MRQCMRARGVAGDTIEAVWPLDDAAGHPACRRSAGRRYVAAKPPNPAAARSTTHAATATPRTNASEAIAKAVDRAWIISGWMFASTLQKMSAL